MCLPKPQVTNNTTTTAPTPPPTAVAQSAQAAQGAPAAAKGAEEARVDEENANIRAKRKGRSGLRIRLDAGNTGGGTGLNIPRA